MCLGRDLEGNIRNKLIYLTSSDFSYFDSENLQSDYVILENFLKKKNKNLLFEFISIQSYLDINYENLQINIK